MERIAQFVYDWLAVLVFCLALLAGGGTMQGFTSDAVVQLASLPLLGLAIVIATRSPFTWRKAAPLLMAALLVAAPAAQLIPLPPSLWTLLPGRDLILASFTQAGVETPWMPLSLSPDMTRRSLLSLIPPVAIFLAVALQDYAVRERMAATLILFAGVSAAFGFAQISAGPESPLYLYKITNLQHPVGFFANRNHFSALLYSAVPYCGAFAVWLTRLKGVDAFIARVVGVGVFLLLMLGVGLAGSRAGLALVIVAGLGVLAIDRAKSAPQDAEQASGDMSSTIMKSLVAIGFVGLAAMIVFGADHITATNSGSVFTDARSEIATVTWEATKAFFPAGSGFGTFVPAYLMFENPAAATSEYINRAHNDVLEMLLESGALGASLLAAFGLWYVFAVLRIWCAPNDDERNFGPLLTRASTIAVALLGLHSFADYPLRTTAMACVFAFACANLLRPATPENQLYLYELFTKFSTAKQTAKPKRRRRRR